MKNIAPPDTSWQFGGLKWVLYLLVGIVPLYVSGSHFFPFATPKGLLVTLGASILALFYILHQNRQTVFTSTWGILDILLVVYGVACVVSAIMGIDTAGSFFGSIADGMGVNLILSLICIALIVGYVVRIDPSVIRTLMTVAFVSALVVALGTYAPPHSFPMPDDGSTLGNTSYTGAYLLVIVCMGIALLYLYQKRYAKVLVGAGILWIICCPIFVNPALFKGALSLGAILHNPLVAMGSANGATMGLFVALAITLFIGMIRSKKKLVKNSGVLLFVGFMVTIFVVGTMFVTPSSALHQSYVATKNENRFVFWDIARRGFLDKPVLGWGMGNYTTVFQKYFDPVFLASGHAYEPWTNNPHNMFFEYMVNGGVVGLLAYVGLLAGAMIVAYRASLQDTRHARIVGLVSVGAIAGYIIQSFFIFDTAVPLLLLFVLIGILIGVSKPLKTFSCSVGESTRIWGIFLGGCAIFFIACWCALNPWYESREWVSYASFGSIINAPHSPYQISNIGNSGNSAFVMAKVVDLMNKKLSTLSEDDRRGYLQVIDNLIQHLQEEEKEGPLSFRANWVLAKMINIKILLLNTADPVLIEQSRTFLTHAIQQNPNNPIVYFDMAQTYMYEQNPTVAFTWMRSAIALAPESRESYAMAERILTAIPNKKFATYVASMKSHWIPQE